MEIPTTTVSLPHGDLNSMKQDLIHILFHCNPRPDIQLTLNKYMLNEWINEATDGKAHCGCQMYQYYFIFSLFFKPILKTGFPSTYLPLTMQTLELPLGQILHTSPTGPLSATQQGFWQWAQRIRESLLCRPHNQWLFALEMSVIETSSTALRIKWKNTLSK